MLPGPGLVARVGIRCFLAAVLGICTPLAAWAAAGPVIADFEGGTPPGFFTYNGGASTVTSATQTVDASEPLARPGQVGTNTILVTQFNIGDFGGLGVDFSASTGPQDWSGTDGFGFWFHGANTGLVYQAEIFDNRSNPSVDTAERFDHDFADDFSGWRYIRIPFSSFSRATDFQPAGAPDDGLTLREMWGWAIVLPNSAGLARTFAVDDVGAIDHVIDDFETGLPAGQDGNGVPIGFSTFQDGSSTVGVSAVSTPPAPVLSAIGTPNTVLRVDLDVASFAGVIHNFQDPALSAWVPQDWSHYEGFAFWIHGAGSGTTLFIDIIENRAPGSTRDDAERWTVTFADDFTAWKAFRFPFSAFARKEIGNGAPNDGLTLGEVHGWALGSLNTGGPRTYDIDQVTLFGAAGIPPLALSFAAGSFGVTEAGAAAVSVKLNRAMNDADPEQVAVSYSIDPGTATPDRDYTPVSGSLFFTRGGSIEQTFTVPTLHDVKHEGTETVILRIADPVSVDLVQAQAVLFITDDDPFDAALLDDFEEPPDRFAASGVSLKSVEIPADDAMAVPGQGPYEGVLEVDTPVLVDIAIRPGSDGRLGCPAGNGVVTVAILSTAWFDATTVDQASVRFGNAQEAHVDRRTGVLVRHVEDADGDGDLDLVLHFRFETTGFACDAARTPLTGRTFSGRAIVYDGFARFGRDFAMGQDWSGGDGLSFWFFGSGTGEQITVQVLDNRAPDPGPAGWTLAWGDEFDGPAGTPPDPRIWVHEIGDGSANGIPGWGNSELQYYTNAPENASMDGRGRLVVTARRGDGSLPCYNGPCQYTSARLKTQRKREIGFGRVESRIRLPRGAGLWPAFWSLGTTIGEVGWPQTGEIDVMEFVGREPRQVFGTIHGPGYSGGASFGGVRDFGRDISLEEHTFAIEWEPGEIRWYVDGLLYHRATPADVAPNAWVFDHPFFLLLNMAVGGNFGGEVGPDTTFPQTMEVDYVRVYRAPDTAERFEASFGDDVAGWRKVDLAFSAFTRSATQPADAPDDGLGLTDVSGYGFVLPEGGTRSGALWLSEVRLAAPTEVTVMTTSDDGAGSLRQAIARVAAGGMVTLDAALSGQTITLTSGSLTLARSVTIDGSNAPGLTISGADTHRVLVVDPGAAATVSNLTIANGFGFDLAGGILNNGSLTLDTVVVQDNKVGAVAGDFWKGGGGIYNGGSSTLLLTNSTVRGNTTQLTDGAGVYAFFNAEVTIENSTISGNTAGNVGGAIRSLGNVTVRNSTLSGNASQAWHGSAIFHTDGVVHLLNATIAGNAAPPGTAAVFVGTFTAASATLTMVNSIVADGGLACFAGFFGAGAVTLGSEGHNVATDGSCNLTAPNDQASTDPVIGPLADNGGPTSTHALLAGSPAIDAADAGQCPATDQRGVTRPQGAGCDVGAFERQP